MTWQPCASLETLKARADLLHEVRMFFRVRDVLEVDTPMIAPFGVSDPYVLNLKVSSHRTAKVLGFLQSSPEYAMKRLLAAGFPSIFQLAKVFRDEERGHSHSPEFTMLEWYRLGFDHHDLMTEVQGLLREVLSCPDAEKIPYTEVFAKHVGLNALSAEVLHLQNRLLDFGPVSNMPTDRNVLLQWLFALAVEPNIGQEKPCFVYDYPLAQAALARQSEDSPQLANRFELFYRGFELANGFFELQDAGEQRKRFEEDNLKRRESGLPEMALDHRFLEALDSGLPTCSGVALGFDRLLMIKLGLDSIEAVLPFGNDLLR